jgi:hypothetical protein
LELGGTRDSFFRSAIFIARPLHRAGPSSVRSGMAAVWTADATEAIELSNNARQFSLSPPVLRSITAEGGGERAGVRANLLLTLSFSPGSANEND